MPDGLWIKCTSCGEILFKQELKENLWVCRKCDHHFQMNRRDRIELLSDPDTFTEWDAELSSKDILKFTGADSYPDKLEGNMKKSGERDAVTTGQAVLDGMPYGCGVMDFSFLGASMGSVVGEKITRLFEESTRLGLPVVLCCASGGARMYEGMFSLMQMAKTSGAIQRHKEAGQAYIAVLTHPTMAGVMASFATLGDVIIAEPNALIGFAGPRVIKETTNADLPPGFQKSEFLLKHGLIDRVVRRHAMRDEVSNLLRFLSLERTEGPPPEAAPASADA